MSSVHRQARCSRDHNSSEKPDTVEPPNISTELPTVTIEWPLLALGHGADAPDAEAVSRVQAAAATVTFKDHNVSSEGPESVYPPNISTALPTVTIVWPPLTLGHGADAQDAEAVSRVQAVAATVTFKDHNSSE